MVQVRVYGGSWVPKLVKNEVARNNLFRFSPILFLQVSSEALADLLRARDDLLIWEEGLEPVYFKFLQPYSTPHIATLLSIL